MRRRKFIAGFAGAAVWPVTARAQQPERIRKIGALLGISPSYSVRPEGAYHQWRKVPSRELSIDLVADERLGWVTDWVEAS